MKTLNRNRNLWLAIFILLSFITKGLSQEGDKLGSWYVYNGFFRFSPKFEVFAESQVRTWEPIENAQTFFIRAFFNYDLHQSFQLGISQEYHNNWSYAEIADDKINSKEYRVTLQSILSHKIARVSIQHRFRYEFRFLDESGKQRTRYRLQLGIPLSADTISKGNWFATVGNEFLINTAPDLSFSQNRLYGMIGYQLSQSSNIQVGYMNIARPNNDSLHRLQFFFTQKLSFVNN